MSIVVVWGQRWDFVAREKVVKSNGSEPVMKRWESRCIECDRLLVCHTPENHSGSTAFIRAVCSVHKTANTRGPGKKKTVNV